MTYAPHSPCVSDSVRHTGSPLAAGRAPGERTLSARSAEAVRTAHGSFPRNRRPPAPSSLPPSALSLFCSGQWDGFEAYPGDHAALPRVWTA